MTYGDGAAWRRGPHEIYARFAAAALDAVPDPLAGLSVVDAGTGTGAMGEQWARRGARVVSCDREPEMLRYVPPPRLLCDITALALRNRVVDAASAGFVLSYVDDPERALAELARVTRRDGVVLATGHPGGGGHPVKAAIEAVLADFGYQPPLWYRRLKRVGEARVGDAPALATLAARAGLHDARVLAPTVSLAGVGEPTVVAWRLGMAHIAPFVASLDAPQRAALTERCRAAVTTTGLAAPVPILALVARV